MKILKLLSLILVISMSISSCQLNEDNVAGFDGNKYETTYFKMVTTGDIAMTVENTTKADLQAGDMYSVVELRKDGTVYNDGEKSGNWSQTGSQITISEIGGVVFTGTIENNTIVLQSENDDAKIEMRFSKL
ncbi:MAG: hypothetical protein ABFS35_14545 [Bacteroidota bacterium]